MPIEQALTIEQTLTPDDLSTMQMMAVPDVWPPVDCCPAVDLPSQQSEPVDGRPGEGGPADSRPGAVGPTWPRQFAVLLAEALTGDRPARQLQPWLSQRGSVHLHRLQPLFRDGRRARVQRVLTTQPTPDVIEMTLIVAVGPRVRALAVRLTLAPPEQRPGWREQRPTRGAAPSAAAPGWLCTDIEAA
jgi:hypothetical protein